MLNSSSFASTSLTVRPARPADEPFLETLYRSSRPDLQAIQGDADLVEAVVEQQYEVLQQGTGNSFPDAMHFVIEKTRERIGGLIVDFGHNEARVIYLAFVPAARGLGHGADVLRGVQRAAASIGYPVSVVVWQSNPRAKRLYLELGFQVAESHPVAERLVWYPQTDAPRVS